MDNLQSIYSISKVYQQINEYFDTALQFSKRLQSVTVGITCT